MISTICAQLALEDQKYLFWVKKLNKVTDALREKTFNVATAGYNFYAFILYSLSMSDRLSAMHNLGNYVWVV